MGHVNAKPDIQESSRDIDEELSVNSPQSIYAPSIASPKTPKETPIDSLLQEENDEKDTDLPQPTHRESVSTNRVNDADYPATPAGIVRVNLSPTPTSPVGLTLTLPLSRQSSEVRHSKLSRLTVSPSPPVGSGQSRLRKIYESPELSVKSRNAHFVKTRRGYEDSVCSRISRCTITPMSVQGLNISKSLGLNLSPSGDQSHVGFALSPSNSRSNVGLILTPSQSSKNPNFTKIQENTMLSLSPSQSSKNPNFLKIQDTPSMNFRPLYRKEIFVSNDYKIGNRGILETPDRMPTSRGSIQGRLQQRGCGMTRPICEAQLVPLHSLGSGQHGVVVKMLDVVKMTFFAIKKIPASDEDCRRQLLRELDAFRGLKHENIVSFHGAYLDPNRNVCLAIEYMDFLSLKDFVIQHKGSLPELFIRHIAHQLAKGFDYLASVRMIHRDVKPDNILLSSNGAVKITDFGYATFVKKLAKVTDFLGSRSYLSPERINCLAYNTPADIWGMGLCLVYCAIGKNPFDNCDSVWDISDMLESEFDLRKHAGKKVFSEEFCSFVNGCLKLNPTERLSAAQLLKHAFLKVSKIDVKSTKLWQRFCKKEPCNREEFEKIISRVAGEMNLQAPIPCTDIVEIVTEKSIQTLVDMTRHSREEVRSLLVANLIKLQEPNSVVTHLNIGGNKISDEKVMTMSQGSKIPNIAGYWCLTGLYQFNGKTFRNIIRVSQSRSDVYGFCHDEGIRIEGKITKMGKFTFQLFIEINSEVEFTEITECRCFVSLSGDIISDGRWQIERENVQGTFTMFRQQMFPHEGSYIKKLISPLGKLTERNCFSPAARHEKSCNGISKISCTLRRQDNEVKSPTAKRNNEYAAIFEEELDSKMPKTPKNGSSENSSRKVSFSDDAKRANDDYAKRAYEDGTIFKDESGPKTPKDGSSGGNSRSNSGSNSRKVSFSDSDEQWSNTKRSGHIRTQPTQTRSIGEVGVQIFEICDLQLLNHKKQQNKKKFNPKWVSPLCSRRRRKTF